MRPKIVIYHNPKCSKSREALDYLWDQGHEPQVVEYLKNPLDEKEIRRLLQLLGIAASSMMRATDFRRLGLEPTDSADELIALIVTHPVLMERPIVEFGDEAVIARPAERLVDFVLPEPVKESDADSAWPLSGSHRAK